MTAQDRLAEIIGATQWPDGEFFVTRKVAALLAAALADKVVLKDDLERVGEWWSCGLHIGNVNAHTDKCRSEPAFVIRGES